MLIFLLVYVMSNWQLHDVSYFVIFLRARFGRKKNPALLSAIETNGQNRPTTISKVYSTVFTFCACLFFVRPFLSINPVYFCGLEENYHRL